jgi:hypothetical protein
MILIVFSGRWSVVSAQLSAVGGRRSAFSSVINKIVIFVPFAENDGEIFFKTAFPSRKYTKHYN